MKILQRFAGMEFHLTVKTKKKISDEVFKNNE